MCGFGLWEISLRIHHQITVSNGNDSRNVKGPEGRRRVKNLHSRAHYLNIQDYAGGLGHKVLTQELPLGKVISSSERHSLTTQIEKEKPTLGVTAPSCSECSGHRQAYDEMKMLTCLRGWSPRILQGNLREALPYVGTGCFLFEFALLSLPYDFFEGNGLRLLAAFIGRLRKFKQGKISAEVLQTNSWEGISWGCRCSLCSDSYMPCVYLQFCSGSFLFNICSSHTQQRECWRMQRFRCGWHIGYSHGLEHQAVLIETHVFPDLYIKLTPALLFCLFLLTLLWFDSEAGRRGERAFKDHDPTFVLC